MSGWRLEERDGVLLLRCEALLEVPGVTHAFSTRRCSGEDTFDLSGRAGEEAQGRRRRFLAAAGLATASVATAKQVHGSRIGSVDEAGPESEMDGIAWTRHEATRRAPAVLTADCVPILMVDREARALAAVHAGWRGTAARIAVAAVRYLERRAGIPADAIRVAIGPSIGPCCYEVGTDVSRQLTGEDRRRSVDLAALNRDQLRSAGVPEGSIHRSGECTRCGEALWFSYRRDGPSAGRMLAVVGQP